MYILWKCRNLLILWRCISELVLWICRKLLILWKPTEQHHFRAVEQLAYQCQQRRFRHHQRPVHTGKDKQQDYHRDHECGLSYVCCHDHSRAAEDVESCRLTRVKYVRSVWLWSHYCAHFFINRPTATPRNAMTFRQKRREKPSPALRFQRMYSDIHFQRMSSFLHFQRMSRFLHFQRMKSKHA